MNRFRALGYDGQVSSRILPDGRLERSYRVRVGRDIIEYADTIEKSDLHAVHGRVGILRHRAIVRRIEEAMKLRRIVPLVQ